MLVKNIRRDELYQASLDLVAGRQSSTHQHKQLFKLISATVMWCTFASKLQKSVWQSSGVR